MHSVLHDVACSMVFRACAAKARALHASHGRWQGQLRIDQLVKRVDHGMRIEYWTHTPLMAAERRDHAAPALEVGSADGKIAVRHDPPFEELWRESAAAAAGVPVPGELQLDFVTTDVELLLRQSAAAVAVAQLALLMGALQAAMARKGVPCDSIEAQLRVVQSCRAADFSAGMPRASTLSSADGAAAMEPSDSPAADDVAWWDAEQLAAALQSSAADPDAQFVAVPALLVIVRGQVMFCVSMDLHSGALVLHSGSFTVPGAAVRQALSLADEQAWLRDKQAAAARAPSAASALYIDLRSEIAEHLAGVFLTGVLRFRAYHRVSLAPSLNLQRAPLRRQLLEDLCARNPDYRQFLPAWAASAFLALPPMPTSLTLLNLLLRCGVTPLQLGPSSLDTRSRCRLQLLVVIGCEHVQPAPGRLAADSEAKQDAATISGALLTSVTDFRGNPVLILRARPVPSPVLAPAQRIAGQRSLDRLLESLAAHGRSSARGWWSEPSAWCSADSARTSSKGASTPRSSHAQNSVTRGDADDSPADTAAVELAEVALLTQWCQDRAVGEYLEAEFRAMGVQFDVREASLPDAPTAPVPRMHAVFAVRGIRSMNCMFPEHAVAWPDCIGAAPRTVIDGERDAVLDASVSSVVVAVTSATSYEVRVTSVVHAVMLRGLDAWGGGRARALQHWRPMPGARNTLVRQYSLLRNRCSAAECVTHLLELVLTRNYFVALEALAPLVPGSDAEAYSLRIFERASKRQCTNGSSHDGQDGVVKAAAFGPPGAARPSDVPVPAVPVPWPPAAPSPRLSMTPATPLSPETPAIGHLTPHVHDAGERPGVPQTQQLSAEEIVPGAGTRVHHIHGIRVEVRLSNLDEISILVFEPQHSDTNGGTDGAIAATPCQTFFLRSGADINCPMTKQGEPQEMLFGMVCQLGAQALVHPKTLEHLAGEIRGGRLHKALSAMAIISFANVCMLESIRPANLAPLGLHPSLTVDVQCLLAPYQYVFCIDQAAASAAPPINGAAPAATHSSYCCKILLTETQSAWFDFSPRQFDQFWELRKRSTARPASGAFVAPPTPVPEEAQLIKALIAAFPGLVSTPASLLSAKFDPVPSEGAVSLEVRYQVLAPVLHRIAQHVNAHVTHAGTSQTAI